MYVQYMYGTRRKNVLKTVRSVCVARRQRFPKNGVKRSVQFRSVSFHGPFRSVSFHGPFRSVARSVPFRLFSTPRLPCDRPRLDKFR